MSSDSNLVSPYGELSPNRQIRALSELTVMPGGIQTGPFGSQLHSSDYVSDGTPIITVEHLGENAVQGERPPLVAIEDVERLKKYVLEEGDIVFSRVGSVDRRALISENEVGWLFSGRLLRVRPDPKRVDPTYLSYFFGLPAFKRYIRSIAVGATMPSLNTELLSNVPVILPSHAEQLAIARLLSDLDMKLKANGSLAKLLEEIVHTIFKSWFIDFDPVKARMAGEAPVGMDAETAALFPDSMEESEIGPVPRGWTMRLLTDLASIRYGAAFSSKKFNSDGLGLPLIRIRDLRTQNPSIYTDEGNPRGFAARAGSLLVGMDGEFEPVIWFGEEAWVNQRVCMVQPNEDCDASFLQFHLKPVLKRIEHGTVGTTVLHLGKSELDSISILYPSRELISAYSSISSAILELRISLAKESIYLRRLRDSILPRLVSGELEVPDETLAA